MTSSRRWRRQQQQHPSTKDKEWRKRNCVTPHCVNYLFGQSLRLTFNSNRSEEEKKDFGLHRTFCPKKKTYNTLFPPPLPTLSEYCIYRYRQPKEKLTNSITVLVRALQDDVFFCCWSMLLDDVLMCYNIIMEKKKSFARPRFDLSGVQQVWCKWLIIGPSGVLYVQYLRAGDGSLGGEKRKI